MWRFAIRCNQNIDLLIKNRHFSNKVQISKDQVYNFKVDQLNALVKKCFMISGCIAIGCAENANRVLVTLCIDRWPFQVWFSLFWYQIGCRNAFWRFQSHSDCYLSTNWFSFIFVFCFFCTRVINLFAFVCFQFRFIEHHKCFAKLVSVQ